jgi:diadenosine tetraphosphate (Ap4A) HIT family hydrolase
MSVHNCDFCEEFSGCNENAFSRIYGQELKSRRLLHSQGFVIVPSLGQIVEGHLLIVPVWHYTAFADIPTHLLAQFSQLYERVRSALSYVYGPVLFFEHGVRGTRSGGCGIDHAHMHALPFTGVNEPIEDLKRKHSFKPVRSISEINQQVSANSPYIYYQQTNGLAWTGEVDFIPSQYLRRILAESLGINSWDWRESGREQALIDSFERLSESFQEPRSSEDSILSPDAKAALAV